MEFRNKVAVVGPWSVTVDWFIQSAATSLLWMPKTGQETSLESSLALCVFKPKSLGTRLNQDSRRKFRIKGSYVKIIFVPLMLLTAGLLMSFAWIGHLKFKSWNFLTALAVSWLLVLPE